MQFNQANEEIIGNGSKNDTFYIIAKGSVSAKFGGHSFLLKKGDIVGIFDITSSYHNCSYYALEDTELIPYFYEDTAAFLKILEENKDIRKLLMVSLLCNICNIINAYETEYNAANELYQYLLQIHNLYHATCRGLSLLSKALPFMDDLQSFSFDDKLPFWMNDYYKTIRKLIAEASLELSSDFVYGFLSRSSTDIENIQNLNARLVENQSTFSGYLLNEDYLDFFDLYSDLFFRAKGGGFDATVIDNSIKAMIVKLRKIPYIDKALVVKRVTAFQQKVKTLHSGSKKDDAENNTDDAAVVQNADLSNAVNIILDYADTMPITAAEFKKYLEMFKMLSDKNAMDKESDNIRKRLTRLFYIIYSEAFQISLKSGVTPPIIKMFLNFGFMDASLCGYENAVKLYQMIDSYHGNKEQGIYTIYEWVEAIFQGTKQPSRNEFEQDYVAFVRNLKREGKIDKETENNMIEDTVGKVMYELQNMLPSVNKITFGRIFTFCPILIEENLCKPIDELLLTSKRILTIFDHLQAIDYSAFYHDTLYEEPSINLKETVRTNIRPDVILMPNVGSKGILWQEIEGMHRNTSGRMMISAFHMENVEKTFIRMIGEFRWEMCKRSQGARWNDVTSHSLTSDYCDYAQFFQKNRDLSSEAKEKIKTNLKRCKNSYRELFLNDYMTYILYESTGSCRLNRVCRLILFRYCPFGRTIRENISGNTIFSDCLDKHHLETAQAVHHLTQVILKYQNAGVLVPDIISSQQKLLDK